MKTLSPPNLPNIVMDSEYSDTPESLKIRLERAFDLFTNKLAKYVDHKMMWSTKFRIDVVIDKFMLKHMSKDYKQIYYKLLMSKMVDTNDMNMFDLFVRVHREAIIDNFVNLGEGFSIMSWRRSYESTDDFFPNDSKTFGLWDDNGKMFFPFQVGFLRGSDSYMSEYIQCYFIRLGNFESFKSLKDGTIKASLMVFDGNLNYWLDKRNGIYEFDKGDSDFSNVVRSSSFLIPKLKTQSEE